MSIFFVNKKIRYSNEEINMKKDDLKQLEHMQKEIRNQEIKEQELQGINERIMKEDLVARESQEFIREKELYQKHLEEKKDALLKEIEEAQHRQNALEGERKTKSRNFSPEVGQNLGPSINHNYAYMPKGHRRIPDYEKENRSKVIDPNFHKEFDAMVNKDRYGNSSNYYKEIEKYHKHQPLLPHGPNNMSTSNVRGVNNIYNTLEMNNNQNDSSPQKILHEKNNNHLAKKVNFYNGETAENSSDINQNNGMDIDTKPQADNQEKSRTKMPPNYKSRYPGVQSVGVRNHVHNEVNYPDYLRGQMGSEFTLENIENKDLNKLNDSYEKNIKQQDQIKNPISSNDQISVDPITYVAKINPKYQMVDNSWQDFYNKTENPQFSRKKGGFIMM